MILYNFSTNPQEIIDLISKFTGNFLCLSEFYHKKTIEYIIESDVELTFDFKNIIKQSNNFELETHLLTQEECLELEKLGYIYTNKKGKYYEEIEDDYCDYEEHNCEIPTFKYNIQIRK